jgi:hypothetical protein
MAGARSVVVSLWEVASEAAKTSCGVFYGHLQAGNPRSEALALARKEIKTNSTLTPFSGPRSILHGGEGEPPQHATRVRFHLPWMQSWPFSESAWERSRLLQ